MKRQFHSEFRSQIQCKPKAAKMPRASIQKDAFITILLARQLTQIYPESLEWNCEGKREKERERGQQEGKGKAQVAAYCVYVYLCCVLSVRLLAGVFSTASHVCRGNLPAAATTSATTTTNDLSCQYVCKDNIYVE